MPFLLGRKNIFLYDHWPFFSLLWIAFPQPLPIFSPFILLSFCLFLVICIILDHNPETCHMLHLVIYVARIFSPMIIYISVQGVLWWGVGSWSNNLNSSFSKERRVQLNYMTSILWAAQQWIQGVKWVYFCEYGSIPKIYYCLRKQVTEWQLNIYRSLKIYKDLPW